MDWDSVLGWYAFLLCGDGFVCFLLVCNTFVEKSLFFTGYQGRQFFTWGCTLLVDGGGRGHLHSKGDTL